MEALMLTHNDPVSFITTVNAEAARKFYESTLGLKFISDEQFALLFDLNGHWLRVAIADEFEPANHTVLGWNVIDIASTVKDLVARGVIFEAFEGMPQDEYGIWDSPSGAKVAWFKDPDGNCLSLTQLGSDR